MRWLIASVILLSGCVRGAENLQVFCWNIHHGRGLDGRIDLERIAAVIRKEQPDLVALQEVDRQCTRSGRVDQCAELARLTGMSGHFGRAMDFGGGQYGLAILSKHPVTTTRVHALPGGKGEPRIAFEAVIAWHGREIRLLTSHLDLDARQRIIQARALAELCAADARPLVLCGDFNDDPGSETITLLAKALPGLPAAPPRPTCPADAPVREIDFIFARGLKPVQPRRVIEEAVASDHRPLAIVLQPAD